MVHQVCGYVRGESEEGLSVSLCDIISYMRCPRTHCTWGLVLHLFGRAQTHTRLHL